MISNELHRRKYIFMRTKLNTKMVQKYIAQDDKVFCMTTL